MKSVMSVTITAPASEIYEIAHETQRWPDVLPHYRFVHVLSVRDGRQTVEMAARRGMIPVRWTALQRNDPNVPAIHFEHVRGWTKGMQVEWRFEERDGRTTVSIVHDLSFRFPFAAKFIEKHIVVGYFIEGIARRTLACMKQLAEQRRNA
jgi:ribosome-associated toxin RatA of RatAB toxin-antitoxin module